MIVYHGFLNTLMCAMSSKRNKKSFVCFCTFLFVSLILSCCTFQGTDRVVHIRDGEIPVREGDTIASLCMEHNVDLKDMVAHNHLQPPYSLKGVDKLSLPHKGVGQTPKDGPQINPSGGWQDKIQEEDDEEEVSEKSWGSESAEGTEGEKNFWGEGAEMTESAKKMKQDAHTMSSTEQKAKEVKQHSAHKGFMYPVQAPLTKSLTGDNALFFRTSKGTPVYVCGRGTVYFAGDMAGDRSGKVVIIKHDPNTMSVYYCLGSLCSNVRKGCQMEKGDEIGKVQGARFKFELRKNRKSVDPRPYLQYAQSIDAKKKEFKKKF